MYKHMRLLCVTILSICSLIAFDLDARGGGRGGGGGGRGGGGRGGGGRASAGRSMASRGGGGRSMQRSPSMSRSVARQPNRAQNVQGSAQRPQVSSGAVQRAQQRPQVSSGAVQRAQQRPQVSQGIGGQRQQFDNRSQIGSKVAQGNVGTRERTLDTRNQVSNFMQNSRATTQLPSQGVNRGQVQQNLGSRNQQFQQNISQRLDARRDTASNIRDGIDRGDVRDRIEDNWGHDYHFGHYAPWAAVAALGAWNWYDSPYYYDYSYGDPYPYVYTDTTYTQTTPTYSQTAPTTFQQPAPTTYYTPESTTEVSSLSQGQETWLPLGTFALSTVGQPTAYPVFYLNISINNKGELDGKLLNITTNVSHDVTGLVDPQTQLAAWKIENNANSPIMETGIYNLTLAESPVQVDFTNGTSQEWLMVRMGDQGSK